MSVSVHMHGIACYQLSQSKIPQMSLFVIILLLLLLLLF